MLVRQLVPLEAAAVTVELTAFFTGRSPTHTLTAVSDTTLRLQITAKAHNGQL